MPNVSVIIPTYNEEKNISACLDSLLKNSLEDFEILVVDDGSTDSTKAIAGSFKRVKIFTQGHRGAGAARNLGAKHAKGQILVFVDADMTFDTEFLKNLIEPISRTIIGTFSKDEFLGNADNVWAKCWNINRGLPPTKMHPKNYPDHDRVFRAITREAFERAGGFNENAGYTDDYSLSEKLGVESVAAPGAVFYHNNPDTISEVYLQAKWMAKRKYKLGVIGYLVALTRAMFPFYLYWGFSRAIIYKEPAFLIFKPIYSMGEFIGILEYMFGRKVSK